MAFCPYGLEPDVLCDVYNDDGVLPYCSNHGIECWYFSMNAYAEYADAHKCDFDDNGICPICGALEYGSIAYRDLYGGCDID